MVMDAISTAWWAALDTDEDGRAARALLCAAVDAARAGHRGALPLPLLTAALRGYATDPGSGSSPDLVERGLARAALPGPGRALEPRDDGFVVAPAVVAAATAARPGAPEHRGDRRGGAAIIVDTVERVLAQMPIKAG
jgi:hypothetical protein